jgi:hypothetical protein
MTFDNDEHGQWMTTFIVTAHYATWTGHMASCRRVVSATDHSHALEIVRERVRGWKRFMGKLSMDCVEMRAVS